MTGLVIAVRFLVRRIAAAVRQRGRLTERVVVVGADEDSIALAEQVNQPGSGMRVVGILDDYMPTGTELPGGLRVVGPSASLLQTTGRLHVQDAIVAPHALPWETLRELMLVSATRANGLRVHRAIGVPGSPSYVACALVAAGDLRPTMLVCRSTSIIAKRAAKTRACCSSLSGKRPHRRAASPVALVA